MNATVHVHPVNRHPLMRKCHVCRAMACDQGDIEMLTQVFGLISQDVRKRFGHSRCYQQTLPSLTQLLTTFHAL
jgi:hypothetical protein